MRAALLAVLVLALGCGPAITRTARADRAGALAAPEVSPPVTVPGLQRDCLRVEAAGRLDGALATGTGAAALGSAGLAASNQLPSSWTPWLVGGAAAATVASQVFFWLYGDDQAKARQCVDDAHKRALEALTASVRGAKP